MIVLQDRYPTPSVLTIRYVRAHGGQPFQGGEDLARLFVLGCIITAGNASVHRERAFKAGAEAFFQKPIENVQFLAKIKKAVGG
jgi:FixJ family two-component response regulator